MAQATLIAVEEGFDGTGRVAEEGDLYYRKPAEFVMEQGCLYACNICGSAYFGGLNDYEAAVRENSSACHFLCGKCAAVELGYGSEFCVLHGNEFIDYKCMQCCSIALFVSESGKKYDCQPCINNAMSGGRKVMSHCKGGPKCPLGIWNHPVADL